MANRVSFAGAGLWIFACASFGSPVDAAHPLFDPHGFGPSVAPPSVMGGAVGAFSNPASWATTGSPETALWWSDRDLAGGPRNWGFSTGRHLGYAVQRSVLPGGGRVYEHVVGIAAGDGGSHGGIATQFTSGDDGSRESAIVLGVIRRPDPRVTWGASVSQSTTSSARVGQLDLGLRPLASPHLTLSGALTLNEDETLEEGRWWGGVQLRPFAGLDLGADVRDAGDDVVFGAHVGVTLEGFGAHAVSRYDEDGHRASTYGLVRMNPPQSGVPVRRWTRERFGPDRVVPIRLENRTVTYQPDRYFDRGRIALLDLLRGLDAVARDPSAAGVALDLSGFRASTAHSWEIRESLARLRARGKRVFVHADRLSMAGYFLATESDYLQLDPEGALRLQGLSAIRTYYADALHKLGVGFEEFRYFHFKSALESFSRRDMSVGDREQLGRLIDQRYEWVRDAVTRSRGLPDDAFDRAVDELAVVPAAAALERNLVDGLGRWTDLETVVREDTSRPLRALPRDRSRRWHPDDRWGAPPRVMVAYAVGPCEMDGGIRGRATAKAIARWSERSDVRGLVLRVDSPGGDPLPSDLVASAADRFRETGKPTVVSQGNVAASGGYWISLPGRPLLTTPFTVTGSIGVIGGWAWDDGFSEKIGITADGVSRGAHADLLGGIRLPLSRTRLPLRPFRADEREIVRERFAELYERFVKRVARSRDLEPARVNSLAEGRVWAGEDALARDLCDGVGTLLDAVADARAQAGLAEDAYVRIEEYPKRRLWNLSRFLPNPLALVAAPRAEPWAWEVNAAGSGPDALDESEVRLPDDVRMMIEHPGDPMVLTPGFVLLE